MDFYSEIIEELKKSTPNTSQWAKLKRDLSMKHKLKDIPTNIQTPSIILYQDIFFLNHPNFCSTRGENKR